MRAMTVTADRMDWLTEPLTLPAVSPIYPSRADAAKVRHRAYSALRPALGTTLRSNIIPVEGGFVVRIAHRNEE